MKIDIYALLNDLSRLPPDAIPLEIYKGDKWRVINAELNGRLYNQTPCLLMHDAKGRLANAFIYDHAYHHTLSAWDNHAVIIGDLHSATSYHVIAGVDDGEVIYRHILMQGENPCIIALPDKFADKLPLLAIAFGHYQPMKVYCTADKKDDLIDQLVNKINANIYASISRPSQTPNALLDADFFSVASVSLIQWRTPIPLEPAKSYDNPYPVEAFGEPLSDVVKMLAYYTQTPLSWAGMAVLGVLSTIGQSRVNAPLGNTYKPSSLFLLTEGESGGGKSKLQDLAYHAVDQHIKNAQKAYRDELNQWQAELASIKPKDRATWLMENPEPNDPDFILDDATIEPALDRFVMGELNNLVWRTDEAAKFFGGHTMKSDTAGSAMGNITSLYSGGAVRRKRSIHSKNAIKGVAYDCRLTFCLSGQRVILEPVLKDRLMAEQGLLARFLFTAEPSLVGFRDWSSKDRLSQDEYTDSVLEGYWTRCGYLMQDLLPSGHNLFTDGELPTDDKGRFNMPFADGAKQHLANFQQSIECKILGELKTAKEVANRMAENASRIATLLAFYDGATKLSSQYLDGAFKLVWHSVREFINYGKDDEKSDAQTVLEWFADKYIPKHQMSYILYADMQSAITPKKLRKKEILENATDSLESHYYIVVQGQPKTVFFNPILLP